MNYSAIKYFLIIILFISCKKDKYDVIDVDYNKKESLDKICSKKISGSTKKIGLQISNYYNVKSAIGFDIDKDGSIDSAAIIRPRTAEQYNDLKSFKCKYVESDKFYLVIVFFDKLKNKKFYYLFDKVISNKSTTLGDESIKSENGQLIIVGDWGHSGKIYSNVYISYHKKKFYVDSLAVESYGLIQKKVKKIYSKRQLNLIDYNFKIIDSIVDKL